MLIAVLSCFVIPSYNDISHTLCEINDFGRLKEHDRNNLLYIFSVLSLKMRFISKMTSITRPQTHTFDSCKRMLNVLKNKADAYGGVTILDLPDTKEEFALQIKHSLDIWKADGKKGK
jgi:hypothetical protein